MYSAKELAIARRIKPDIEVAQLDVTDLAVLQLVRKATGGGSGVFNATIENGIAYFDGVTVSQPLVSLKLNIPVTQTGSGTPSPDNKRDFIGFGGVNTGQTSDYGKYFRGLLNGTYGFVDLGDLEWKYTSATTRFYTEDITNISLEVDFTDMLCSGYNVISSAYSFANMPDKSIKRGVSSAQISIRDLDYTDATAFANVVSGVYLIYELETPTTPSITPQDFAALCQAFGITGNTYPITFGQTVYSAILDVLNRKLYLIDEIKTIDENTSIAVSNGIFAIDNFFNISNDTESVDCNVYQRGENRTNTAGVRDNNPDYSFCCRLGSTPTRVMIKDTRYTSVDDYKAWLTNNPVKIAVKLAEPIEIQLTPTEITTLIGENVIFADVADVTECKFTRK